MVDGVGTTTYGYAAFGALASEDGPWADDIVTYSYANRLRSSLSLAQPNASPWVQSYAYDATRRLTHVTSAAGSFGYQYNPGIGATTASTLVKRLVVPTAAGPPVSPNLRIDY